MHSSWPFETQETIRRLRCHRDNSQFRNWKNWFQLISIDFNWVTPKWLRINKITIFCCGQRVFVGNCKWKKNQTVDEPEWDHFFDQNKIDITMTSEWILLHRHETIHFRFRSVARQRTQESHNSSTLFYFVLLCRTCRTDSDCDVNVCVCVWCVGGLLKRVDGCRPEVWRSSENGFFTKGLTRRPSEKVIKSGKEDENDLISCPKEMNGERVLFNTFDNLHILRLRTINSWSTALCVWNYNGATSFLAHFDFFFVHCSSFSNWPLHSYACAKFIPPL